MPRNRRRSDVAGALNGSEAFVSLLLDGQLAEVAADVEWTAGELANTLLTDDSLFVTDAGDLGVRRHGTGTW